MNTNIARSIPILAALLASGLAAAQNTAPAGPAGRRGPPPMAYEACASKTAGTACTFTACRGEVSGTCQTAFPGSVDKPVCLPANRPGPGMARGRRGDGQWSGMGPCRQQ
jgi:hypothetical protein